MKMPSLGNSACAKIGSSSRARGGLEARLGLSSTERASSWGKRVWEFLGRADGQCHLGGVSKGRGSPWERGDEDRRSESTREDCWMKQAGYRYVSHTLLSCACAQNVPGAESWS